MGTSEDVVAVVLTFRRERLATQVVRGLIDTEGFAPSQVIVVVNGEGGLDDPGLEHAVRMVRLDTNLGPAGGFRKGLEVAADTGARWAYLCEDDIGLFDLPSPRVADLVARVDAEPDSEAIGAVVAYGRTLDRRTGRTVPAIPDPTSQAAFPPVDAAAWGASLVRCRLVEQGILPDPRLFFGFEDFDFWFAMQRAGFRLVLDGRIAHEVAGRVFHDQRDESLRDARPIDAEEPWRRYYEARNFMTLRRRYGRRSWTLSHVAMTARRAQLSPTWAHRRAAFHGLWDGLRGRLGTHPRYTRTLGERTPGAQAPSTAPVLQIITDNDRRGGQVFASDLHRALLRRDVPVHTMALAPASSAPALNFEVLGPSRRHPRTLRALRSVIARSAVVVGHGSTTLPMCAAAGLGSKTPFVYRQISEQRFWANTPGRRARTRLALRAADHVVALWEGAATTLVEGFGVDRERITVIPNGVPGDRCEPVDQDQRREARQRFGLDPDRQTLVSIGALVLEKGVDVLARAMLESELSDWQLLVVGAGPERPRLERLATQLPAGTVRIHDPVASGREALGAADVVGLTSRGGDSMPAVLIEAGMMGIPSVATPVEGIVEIVLDGRTGRLVPKDDPAATAAAVHAVGDRSAEYGAAAQTHCLANFEIEIVAARWHELLDAVRTR